MWDIKNDNEYLAYIKRFEELKAYYEYKMNMALIYEDSSVEELDSLLEGVMKYKLLPKDDDLISSAFKILKKNGMSNDFRYQYDYRNPGDYIHEWFYNKIPRIVATTVKSVEHKSKRVEGRYEGDITVPSREYTVKMSLDNSSIQVKNSFRFIESLYKGNFKGDTRNKLEQMSLAGVYRVYDINIEDEACIPAYRKLGVMVLAFRNEKYEARYYFNYSNFRNLHLTIKETVICIVNSGNSIVKNMDNKLMLDPNKNKQ